MHPFSVLWKHHINKKIIKLRKKTDQDTYENTANKILSTASDSFLN